VLVRGTQHPVLRIASPVLITGLLIDLRRGNDRPMVVASSYRVGQETEILQTGKVEL
jgi:hypothetical protein